MRYTDEYLKSQTRIGFNHRLITLLAALNLFVNNACNAQMSFKNKENKNKWSISCCFNTIKRQLPKNAYRLLDKSSGNYQYMGKTMIFNRDEVCIYDKGIKLELRSDSSDFSEWTDVIDWDSVKVYEIKNSPYFVACSSIENATGISVHFYKWLIIDWRSGYYSIFWSLSSDPSFFKYSNEALEFWVFDYSSEFLEQRDNNHISLAISQKRMQENKVVEISRETQNCSCN